MAGGHQSFRSGRQRRPVRRREGGLFNPAEGNERAPEIWFVDFLTMGMSKDGRDQVMQAMEVLSPEIRNLEGQGDTIKNETVSLLLADKPNTPRITESVRELEAVMQRRLAAMHEALIPVVSRLGADDRRIFATRWEAGPRNGPPPPRPPR